MLKKSIDSQMVDVIRLMQAAECSGDIRDIFARLLQDYGYEKSEYLDVITADDLDTHGIEISASGETEHWLAKHAEQEILHFDDNSGFRFKTRYPFTWRDVLDNMEHSPLARQFYIKIKKLFEGKDGFIAPIHGPEGSITVLAVYGKRPDTSPETIRGLGTVAFFHQAALEQVHNTEKKGGNNNLLACIRFIATGKSDLEISHLLGISEEEVNFQISRAINGLGVSTRAQAVEEAARRNLISL